MLSNDCQYKIYKNLLGKILVVCHVFSNVRSMSKISKPLRHVLYLISLRDWGLGLLYVYLMFCALYTCCTLFRIRCMTSVLLKLNNNLKFWDLSQGKWRLALKNWHLGFKIRISFFFLVNLGSLFRVSIFHDDSRLDGVFYIYLLVET